MTVYLAIITTVLVATQVIRIVQNGINLHRYNKVAKAEIKRLGEVSNEDIETQKQAYRLIVEYFKTKGGANNDR